MACQLQVCALPQILEMISNIDKTYPQLKPRSIESHPVITMVRDWFTCLISRIHRTTDHRSMARTQLVGKVGPPSPNGRNRCVLLGVGDHFLGPFPPTLWGDFMAVLLRGALLNQPVPHGCRCSSSIQGNQFLSKQMGMHLHPNQ